MSGNAVLDIEISVEEAAARRAAGEALALLDVREDWEFEQAHIAGAEHIPLAQLPQYLERFQNERADEEIICYCHSGRRSLTAADWLRRSGCSHARSLAGGIDAWSVAVDPAIPRY
ncbi:MAG: rhodanese-like domain-containing protein [Terriglobales bacterium]